MTDHPAELVERVAKAIFEARMLDLDQEGDEWDEIPDDWQEEWRDLAVAALDAMGLPSREQIIQALADARGLRPGPTAHERVALGADADAIIALLNGADHE